MGFVTFCMGLQPAGGLSGGMSVGSANKARKAGGKEGAASAQSAMNFQERSFFEQVSGCLSIVLSRLAVRFLLGCNVKALIAQHGCRIRVVVDHPGLLR